MVAARSKPVQSYRNSLTASLPSSAMPAAKSDVRFEPAASADGTTPVPSSRAQRVAVPGVLSSSLHGPMSVLPSSKPIASASVVLPRAVTQSVAAGIFPAIDSAESNVKASRRWMPARDVNLASARRHSCSAVVRPSAYKQPALAGQMAEHRAQLVWGMPDPVWHDIPPHRMLQRVRAMRANDPVMPSSMQDRRIRLWCEGAPEALLQAHSALPRQTPFPSRADAVMVLPSVPPTRLRPSPGACSFVRPVCCAACGAKLSWYVETKVDPFTTCKRCFLSCHLRPHELEPPPVPCLLPGMLHDRPRRTEECLAALLGQDPFAAHPTLVDDYRWASVRVAVSKPEVACVYRNNMLLAVMPVRQARFIRALFLQSWVRAAPECRWNEADVAAAFVSLALSVKPGSWPLPPAETFRGDQHVFMSFTMFAEPGFCRPAFLPLETGPLFWAHPAQSAYTPVGQFAGPLSVLGHLDLLRGHPLRGYLVNSLQVGFSLQSQVPWESREPRRDRPVCDELLRQQEAELAAGSMIPITDWPDEIPRLFSPWIAATRKDRIRGVWDLTWGDGSVNDATRRKPLLPARLAKWHHVLGRIQFLEEQCPGRPVKLAKLDASRAFRQVPIPVREFWMTATMFSGEPVVHTRLPFGAVVSVDQMSYSTSAVQDIAATTGVFLATYVDDQLVIDYADRIEATVAFVKGVWARLGWPLNTAKYAKEGEPASIKEFLGVELNLISATAAMSAERVASLKSRIEGYLNSEAITFRQVRSLVGELSFVAAVVPFGKVFAAHLFKAFAAGNDLHMSVGLKADLRWWTVALTTFNGMASIRTTTCQPSFHVASDASKAGWGVISPFTREMASGKWRQLELDGAEIHHLEAAAIVLAGEMFGHYCSGGLLVVHTDSSASHAAFRGQRAHDPQLLELLRLSALAQMRSSFRLVTEHIPGKRNVLADSLSRRHRLPDGMPPFVVLKPNPCIRLTLIGGVLSQTQPRLPSPEPSHETLLLDIFTRTAKNTDISQLQKLPWTRWSHLRWDSPSMDVFSTWPPGWQPDALPSKVNPFATTLAKSVRL